MGGGSKKVRTVGSSVADTLMPVHEEEGTSNRNGKKTKEKKKETRGGRKKTGEGGLNRREEMRQRKGVVTPSWRGWGFQRSLVASGRESDKRGGGGAPSKRERTIVIARSRGGFHDHCEKIAGPSRANVRRRR